MIIGLVQISKQMILALIIEEVYPSEYKISDDIHNFEVLKRLSTLHRDGVLVTFNGMRNFVKECVSFSYE